MRPVPRISRRSFAVISMLTLMLFLAVVVTRRLQAKDEPKAAPFAAPEIGGANAEPPAEEAFEVQPPVQPTPREDAFGLDREQLRPVPNPIGAVVFDEPVPGSPAWLAGLFCPLPARIEMLASETPDAAETEKLRTLQESYEEILKDKASLLNAEALSAEIELQRRQVTELKALRELQKLQQSLEELSDKFPDSDAGKQARDVLNLLKQRRAHPHQNLVPTLDDGFNRNPAAPYDPTTLDPSQGYRDDRVHPRKKPVTSPGVFRKPVPNPKENFPDASP